MAIDVEKRAPVFRNVFAGLSGPAVKPLALRMVWETARQAAVPVIGMGGITCGRDVLEFILAGACAVQIGTINLIEPGAAARILQELEETMTKLGIHNLEEIKGELKL
jgi:dihydroorotate dehydrogenase (NAD+) catalytic subunit